MAPSTERAMRAMLEQIEAMPEPVPSPWHEPEALAGCQEGTVADFTE